jgi:hypothetical protein
MDYFFEHSRDRPLGSMLMDFAGIPALLLPPQVYRGLSNERELLYEYTVND